MEKTRAIKTFKFIVFLIVVVFIVFAIYYLVGNKKNPFSDIIDNITQTEMKDNYNGFYHYKDDLGGSRIVFTGCTVNYISDLILVVEDKYYVYRSSCMGTYPKGSGDTKDLDFRVDESKKSYYIKYKGKDYDKDNSLYSVEPLKEPFDDLRNLNIEEFGLLMKETQIPGYYYEFSEMASNISSSLQIELIPINDGEAFTLNINDFFKTLYTYHITDKNLLPEMFPYGKYLVLIEKTERKTAASMLKSDNLVVIGPTGPVYNLRQKFPVIVDDVELNAQNSIYITFDHKEKVFKMLVGYDDKFCVTDGKSDKVVAYEFTIDYNYLTKEFDDPVFSKKIREKDGCLYVKNLMEG